MSRSLEEFFVSYCSSVFYPAIRSISSENLRLYNSYSPTDMVLKWSSRVSCIIFVRKILKSVGYKKHPCSTPTDVLKKDPVFLVTKTAMFIF